MSFLLVYLYFKTCTYFVKGQEVAGNRIEQRRTTQANRSSKKTTWIKKGVAEQVPISHLRKGHPIQLIFNHHGGTLHLQLLCQLSQQPTSC